MNQVKTHWYSQELISELIVQSNYGAAFITPKDWKERRHGGKDSFSTPGTYGHEWKSRKEGLCIQTRLH